MSPGQGIVLYVWGLWSSQQQGKFGIFEFNGCCLEGMCFYIDFKSLSYHTLRLRMLTPTRATNVSTTCIDGDYPYHVVIDKLNNLLV